MKKSEIKRLILNMRKEEKRFPKIKELSEKLDLSLKETRNIVNSLVMDGFLIKTKNNWYKISPEVFKKREITGRVSIKKEESPENEEMEFEGLEKDYVEEYPEILEASEEDVYIIPTPETTETPTQEVKEAPVSENLGTVPIKILQFFMTVIGLGAVCISVYYTAIWMFEFLPFALGFLLSAIMVGFSVSAFETIIVFLSGHANASKTARVFIVTGFSFLWIVVVAFSIVSTVAGQYNQYIKNIKTEAKDNSKIISSQIRWNSIQDRKKEIKTRIKENRTMLTSLINLGSNISEDLETRSEYRKTWGDTQYRIRLINKELKGLNKELAVLYNEERKELKARSGHINTLSGQIKELPDFYSWIAKLFGITKDHAQFWMSLFPAVFVDLIAPVALAVALFLNKKRKEGV